MPSEGDDCDTQTDRWYYNKDELTCLNFMYGDCPQPGNNFASVQECENACKGAGKGPPQVPLPPSRPPQRGGACFYTSGNILKLTQTRRNQATKRGNGHLVVVVSRKSLGGHREDQFVLQRNGHHPRGLKKKMRPWRNDLEGVDGHGRDHVRDLVRQSRACGSIMVLS
ncbi:hypothetical protein MRX96_015596 [Rhipicephalus microplus]